MKQKDNGAKAMGKDWSNNAQSDYIYGIILGAPLILGFMMGGSYLAYHTNPCIKRQQISLEQRCINKEKITPYKFNLIQATITVMKTKFFSFLYILSSWC